MAANLIELYRRQLNISLEDATFLANMTLADGTPIYRDAEDIFNLIGALSKMTKFTDMVSALKGPADSDLSSPRLAARTSFDSLYYSLPAFEKERRAEESKIGQFSVSAGRNSRDKRPCPKCRAVGTIISLDIQTRSADEGAEVFSFCTNCASRV